MSKPQKNFSDPNSIPKKAQKYPQNLKMTPKTKNKKQKIKILAKG